MFSENKAEDKFSCTLASRCTVSSKAPGSSVDMGCSLPGIKPTGLGREQLQLKAVRWLDVLGAGYRTALLQALGLLVWFISPVCSEKDPAVSLELSPQLS